MTDWPEVVQAVLANPDPSVTHRGLVLIKNIIQADIEFAAKIIETNIMELLMALTKVEDAKITKLAEEALRAAENYKLIQKNENPVQQPPPPPTSEVLLEQPDDPDMPELE